MDIEPISIAQVRAGRDGRQYEISGQAGDIVRQLRELDPTLRVVFNEGGNFFAVQQVVDRGGHAVAVEGDETQRVCVGRFRPEEWDARVVRDFEMRAHEVRNGISAADRLEAGERAYHAARDYAFDQDVRERADRLFHGWQRSMGLKPRAYIGARRRAAA